MVIVGANEVATGTVNLRLLNGDQVSLPSIETAIDYLNKTCRAPDIIDQQQIFDALRIA